MKLRTQFHGHNLAKLVDGKTGKAGGGILGCFEKTLEAMDGRNRANMDVDCDFFKATKYSAVGQTAKLPRDIALNGLSAVTVSSVFPLTVKEGVQE